MDPGPIGYWSFTPANVGSPADALTFFCQGQQEGYLIGVCSSNYPCAATASPGQGVSCNWVGVEDRMLQCESGHLYSISYPQFGYSESQQPLPVYTQLYNLTSH